MDAGGTINGEDDDQDIPVALPDIVKEGTSLSRGYREFKLWPEVGGGGGVSRSAQKNLVMIFAKCIFKTASDGASYLQVLIVIFMGFWTHVGYR